MRNPDADVGPPLELSDAPPLCLEAVDLQCKRGFGDGSLVTDWLTEVFPDLDYESGEEWPIPPDRTLRLLVWSFLIPRIEQEITPHMVFSYHNPIRVETVNGEGVNAQQVRGHPMTPEVVEVAPDAVWRVGQIARKRHVPGHTLEPEEMVVAYLVTTEEIAEAMAVAAEAEMFGEEELMRALRSPNQRLRDAALVAAGMVELEPERPAPVLEEAPDPSRPRGSGRRRT